MRWLNHTFRPFVRQEPRRRERHRSSGQARFYEGPGTSPKLTPSFIPHILISIRFKEASVMIHDRKSALLFGTVIAIVLLVAASPAAAQTKLLRFPAIHGDKVAFTYAGDIWIAPAAGGTAARLTAHPGHGGLRHGSRPTGSGSPSPASTTATSRSTSCPSTGGEPKQLTYLSRPAARSRRAGAGTTRSTAGPTDGKSILFRSHARFLDARANSSSTPCR